MEENNTKVCKMCYKEIPDKAKKCPYCHHLQKRFSSAVWGPFLPMIIFIIPLIAMWYAMKNTFDKGEDFTPYRNQITISGSELKFGEKKTGETIAVIGTMSNKSSVPWKDVQIEVRFYDINGKMIDSEQQKDYPFEVPADDIAAFKVSTLREFPKEQYVKYEVSIISARDARTRW
jgi:hypothetical protein